MTDDTEGGGKFKLAAHQEYAVFMMDTNPHLGIFYDMGCGKTMVALTWLYRALQEGRIMRALIVCPASLVVNWEDSIDKMLQFEGFTEKGVEFLRKSVDITSFQKTYRSVKTPVTHRDGHTTTKKSVSLRPEVDRQWGAVIIDESHCIGSHSSIQTKACLTLARLAKHRFIMTATPVHGGKGIEDFSKLYGQMRFLEPDIWTTWTQFCARYVTRMDHWYRPQAYQVDSCRDLMRNHAIVCRLEDCFDMPGFIETDVPCELEEQKVYKDIKAGNLEAYDLDIESPSGRFTKLLQVCSGSLITDNGVRTLKTSKDDALADILAGTDDKVVVFCNYTASVNRCADICRKAGRKTVVFDGHSKGPTWKEFQYGDAQTLVCQYASGGPGLDLFASAHMVMYEPCFSALLFEQATGRVYRKGQDRKVQYMFLTTPRTMEQKCWEIVRSGADVTANMLDAWAHDEIEF